MSRPIQLFLFFFFTLMLSGPSFASEGGGEGKATGATYVDLKPSFVTNVGGPSQRLSYLKVDVTLRVSSQEIAKEVESQQPAIRNALVFLFSSAKMDEATSPKGQEELRHEALKAVNEVMEKEEGKKALVENVLFTTFVVQK